MNESMDQQLAHRPAPSTGLRHDGQSWGKATRARRWTIPRMARVSSADRLAGAARGSISASIVTTLASASARAVMRARAFHMQRD